MHLHSLRLVGFRCFADLDLSLPPGRSVIAGRNGQGKSTLLEAAYVLATTRGPHGASDRDLVAWQRTGEAAPFARVLGHVDRAGTRTTLEVILALQDVPGGDPRLVKRISVNGAPRRALDAIGILNVVLFTPRHLDLVDGAPAERRRYLDIALCQVDPAYTRALSGYNRILQQRSHLLRRLRSAPGGVAELDVWDERLAIEGGIVLARRIAAVADLGLAASEIHARLAGGPASRPRLRTTYLRSHATDLADGAGPFAEPAPDASACAAALLSALHHHRAEDIARGATTAGPHRDDLAFAVDGKDQRRYGSRGQQRMVALAWKLAEATLMRRATGEEPVLLLDDVLSELDAERRAFLLAAIDPAQQTLLTTTDPERLDPAFLQSAALFTADNGSVVPRHAATA